MSSIYLVPVTFHIDANSEDDAAERLEALLAEAGFGTDGDHTDPRIRYVNAPEGMELAPYTEADLRA